MCKLRRYPASFVLATGCLILMVALLGCEGPDLGFDLSPDWPEAKSITIVPDALVLLDGQRDTLEAIVIRSVLCGLEVTRYRCSHPYSPFGICHRSVRIGTWGSVGHCRVSRNDD
jgi:hypothetical protein